MVLSMPQATNILIGTPAYGGQVHVDYVSSLLMQRIAQRTRSAAVFGQGGNGERCGGCTAGGCDACSDERCGEGMQLPVGVMFAGARRH